MFDSLNTSSESGIDQFRVESVDGCRLLVVGSFDLCYYHSVEVEFTDVAYLACATSFCEPKFRVGTRRERRSVARVIGDFDESLYCIDADAGWGPSTFLVAARDVVVREGTVYHYPRTDLRPGERVAPWVKAADPPPTRP